MDLSKSSSIPSLSISLSLSPPLYRLTEPRMIPTLSLEVTLHASQPITIFTWNTILNLEQALHQYGFEIIDKSTNTTVPQITTTATRPAIKRQLGSLDERLFVTLMPEVPYTVQTPFGFIPVNQTQVDEPINGREVHGVRGLKNGEYTLRVNRAKGSERKEKYHISWWRYGTKEDNLEPARSSGAGPFNTSLGKSEEPSPLVLDVDAIPEVDFSVE